MKLSRPQILLRSPCVAVSLLSKEAYFWADKALRPCFLFLFVVAPLGRFAGWFVIMKGVCFGLYFGVENRETLRLLAVLGPNDKLFNGDAPPFPTVKNSNYGWHEKQQLRKERPTN